MLLGLGAEAQAVHLVDDLAEVVAGGDLVLDLAEDLTDPVLDRVGLVGVAGGEAVQVGEELRVNEVDQVGAGEGGVVVDLPVLPFGGGPAFSPVRLVEDEAVFLPSSPASAARSCSRPSRYFRKRSQEVCSV